MIKVNKHYFGDYFQKIIIDGKKIIDVECTCKWGQIHKKAWKEGEKVCKHVENAIIFEQTRFKKLSLKNDNKYL